MIIAYGMELLAFYDFVRKLNKLIIWVVSDK